MRLGFDAQRARQVKFIATDTVNIEQARRYNFPSRILESFATQEIADDFYCGYISITGVAINLSSVSTCLYLDALPEVDVMIQEHNWIPAGIGDLPVDKTSLVKEYLITAFQSK